MRSTARRAAGILIVITCLVAAPAAMAKRTLQLGENLVTVNPDCSADYIEGCSEDRNPDELRGKAVHAVSIMVDMSGPGHCIASASVFDPELGNSGSALILIEAAAVAQSPGLATLALPQPIRINANNSLHVAARIIGDDNEDSDCRVEAHFVVELLDADE